MTDYTAEISAAMATGMAAENRRREVASQTPGLGAKVELPPVPYGPGVGIADVPLPVIGESHQAAPYVEQRKSYGPPAPVYADPVVAGVGYAPADIQTALRAAGERVFAAQAAASRGDVAVVSPDMAPRRSLLGRLLGRLRGR
jgi:hypothetical protein